MTASVLAPVRVGVARAADAPAPTIVVDGRGLLANASRDEVLAWVEPYRRRAMSLRPDLGLKTAVVMAPTNGVFPVHFFQGASNGEIDASVPVCVNSAAAAVTVATRCWGATCHSPAVLMDGDVYGLEEVA